MDIKGISNELMNFATNNRNIHKEPESSALTEVKPPSPPEEEGFDSRAKKEESQSFDDLAQDLNHRLKGLGQNNIKFEVDDKSDEVVIRVVDQKSHEVIKQIPTEEVMKLKEHIENAKGIILNELI